MDKQQNPYYQGRCHEAHQIHEPQERKPPLPTRLPSLTFLNDSPSQPGSSSTPHSGMFFLHFALCESIDRGLELIRGFSFQSRNIVRTRLTCD